MVGGTGHSRGGQALTADFSPNELDRGATFYVAGHCGLVGSAIVRRLKAGGFENIVGQRSAELDLRNRERVFDFLAETRPRYVVLAAAKVGGILANNTYPVDFLSDNLQIQVNVLDASLNADVERLLFLGSSCIYPKFAEQPIREESLLTGTLEPTNDAYAIAKIAGILHVQAVRRQYGLPWISAMPTNLYGPNDNFSPTGSHVVPSLIRRYEEGVRSGASSVTNWGNGSPRRELLHADDMADACLYLLEHYDGPAQINVGTGTDLTIREIADTVASVVGYNGQTNWDETKPNGTPQKLLDVSKLAKLGWTSKISVRSGLESTVKWYRSQHGTQRGFPGN
jgi:GDP-L-fucose synthase